MTDFSQPSPILRLFNAADETDMTKLVRTKFYELASTLESILPNGPEKTVALRKLLEAQDQGVRATR